MFCDVKLWPVAAALTCFMYYKHKPHTRARAHAHTHTLSHKFCSLLEMMDEAPPWVVKLKRINAFIVQFIKMVWESVYRISASKSSINICPSPTRPLGVSRPLLYIYFIANFLFSWLSYVMWCEHKWATEMLLRQPITHHAMAIPKHQTISTNQSTRPKKTTTTPPIYWIWKMLRWRQPNEYCRQDVNESNSRISLPHLYRYHPPNTLFHCLSAWDHPFDMIA